MKKNNPLLIAAFVLFVLSILFAPLYLVSGYGQYRRTWLPPHAVLDKNGLDIAWEWNGDRIDSTNPYLLTAEQNLILRGHLRSGSRVNYFVIDGLDGKLLATQPAQKSSEDFVTDGSSIYVSSYGGVSRYDTFSGKRIWYRELNAEGKRIRGIQFVHGDIQAYDSYFTTFYQIAIEDGAILSRLDERGKVEGRVLRYDQGYYFLLHGEQLRKVDEAGNIKWKQEIPWLHRFDDFPVFSSNMVYVRSEGMAATVYAIDQSTGRLLWQTKPKVISNVVASPKRVYFLMEDGYLYGVRSRDAKVEVSVQFSGEGFTTRNPIAYDSDLKQVYVLLQDSGQLFAFHESRK